MKVLKSRDGFTLVELVITIAIIGVLAAVTIPNFKKYQARSKIVEAKIQLASAYTAEVSFFQLFNLYATCLNYMGFNPENEKNARHFAIGFPNFQANINTIFYNSAVGERLVGSECPRDLVDTPGMSVFLAEKAIGNTSMNNLADFRSATPIVSNSINETSGPFSTEIHSGLGDQSIEATQSFVIAAAGYIEPAHLDPLSSCLWTINQNKKLTNHREGY